MCPDGLTTFELTRSTMYLLIPASKYIFFSFQQVVIFAIRLKLLKTGNELIYQNTYFFI